MAIVMAVVMAIVMAIVMEAVVGGSGSDGSGRCGSDEDGWGWQR
jgi:hypothetical protein